MEKYAMINHLKYRHKGWDKRYLMPLIISRLIKLSTAHSTGMGKVTFAFSLKFIISVGIQ